MAQIIERIVRSKYPPRNTRVLWLDTKNDLLKVFTSNGWTKVLSNTAINTLRNAGYLFAGIATIDTNPETPDAKVFYIANGKGTYTHFGGINVTEDDVIILYYDNTWHKVATGIASQEKLSELESEINGEGKKTITPSQGSNFIAEIDVNKGDNINISAIASTPLTVNSYIILYMNEERIYSSKLIDSSNTQGSIPPFNVKIAGKVVIKFEYNEYTQNTIDFIISPAKKGALDLINDLADSLANTKTSIGELSDLETEKKDSIVSSINELNAIAGKTIRHLTDEEIISGSYRVIPNGELAGHKSYSYTRPIEVYSGDTVKLIGAVITPVCVITKVDAENNPINVLLVGQGADVSEYEYIVESDGYISISCLSNIISTVTISHSNLPKYELPIDNIDRLWKVTENPLECIKRERGYGAIIQEWGFIGDSYSSGETPAKDSSGVLVTNMDFYKISWGQQFARLIGANGYNFSNGGQTAKGWLRSQGTKHDSSYIGGEGGGDWNHAQLDKKQAYFISLGINDNGYINRWEQEGKQYLGDAYTLGNVETDIDLNNYANNNENTFVGCYAGIIQRLLSIQPKAKIFVVTQFQPALDHINSAIRSIASKFPNNVFIIDLRMYAPNITDNMQYYMKNGHPTPYGYMYMAYLMNTYVDWIIRNNKDKFMDVTLIGTDYSL